MIGGTFLGHGTIFHTETWSISWFCCRKAAFRLPKVAQRLARSLKQGDVLPGSSCDPELPIGEGCRSPVAYRLNSSSRRRG
jgi:hypothetical protein